MILREHFRQFLTRIRPTQEQQDQARDAHRRLRDKLKEDVPLDEHVLLTFLQGSYRRSTDIRPIGDKKSDVDVVVVTNMSEDRFSPADALEEFRPFLETHYQGCYEEQDRSWGIVDGEVELDLVPTSAPTEAEAFRKVRDVESAFEPGLEKYAAFREALTTAARHTSVEKGGLLKEAAALKGDAWRDEPLRIPDRPRVEWRDTHPLKQIDWTQDKNARCNDHYVDVVRVVKWTHIQHAGDVHPKGYPLEALVGAHCPDGIESVAEGVVGTLEQIVAKQQRAVKPAVMDHGVDQNVFMRVTPEQRAEFYDRVCAFASKARAAYDEQDRGRSVALWRDLLGADFRDDDDDGGNERGFPKPTRPPASAGPERRFA